MKNKRRKAIDCKLIRPSNSNKGYFKYEVTIEEKDGTIHKEPAYGTDMQSALSRLIKKEITTKFERKFLHAGYLFFGWMFLMGWPVLVIPHIADSPWYIAYSFGSIFLTFTFAALWYNHVNKQ